MTERRPHILVLMSDQHSRHMLGCYGNRIVRTPNLDRLAAQGMRLTDAYCPAPLCVPSRMSFMTSRRPGGIRVWTNSNVLSSDVPTWAHALGAAGYETALIGRMHFAGVDQWHGFQSRPLGELKARWERIPRITCSQWREAAEIAGKGTTEYGWYDEQVTEAAIRFLREQARAPHERPFAAVAGFLLPHCPFVAPVELFDYYYDRVEVPSFHAEREPATIRRFREVHRLDPPLRDEQIRAARAAYFGMCEHLDRLIGRILQALEETDLARDTLVVYTSDHGEMGGEHGCWFKSVYYEGSVGVPLICRLPGAIEPASTSSAVCNLMDLGPTFAEICGGEPLQNVDGHSLGPILRGQPPDDWPNETYSELVNDRASPGIPSRMIRSGRWKLWVDGDERASSPALFDLSSDPGEEHDLSGDPACEETKRRLLEKVYQDWDPAWASAEAARRKEDRRLVGRAESVQAQPEWGTAITRPTAPPGLDSDVQFV